MPRIADAQFAVGGVYIDSQGMLRHTSRLTDDERLKVLRFKSGNLQSSSDVGQPSPLRKVSLRRLEEAIAKLRSKKQPLTGDVQFLAGLNTIRYIFFFPEENDVVIAGPAESWKQLPTGEFVGNNSNRPVLHLGDLIVALRFAFDGVRAAPFIGCSIDPTPQGFQNYAAYMKKLGGRMNRSRLKQIFSGMEQAMGPQAVRLFGVPGTSRFATKLVAADYRLKRIALGHDPSPAKGVTNFLDLRAKRLKNVSGPQRQHRWWFVGQYDAISHTPDELAFELEGQGVHVATAPTLTAGGNTKGASKKQPQASVSARQFAMSFSKHFPEIAHRIPVFAELQNLVGLSVVAELIAQQHRANAGGRNWKPTHLIIDDKSLLEEFSTPTRVPSLANYRLVRGRHWLISVSGGVEINPREMTGSRFRKESTQRVLGTARKNNTRPDEATSWWWD